jgi:hypothetical protein
MVMHSGGPLQKPATDLSPDALWKLPVNRWLVRNALVSNGPEAHVSAVGSADRMASSPAPCNCSVSPLPPIKDPEARAFEASVGTDGIVDTAGLTPPTAKALARFEHVVASVGGTLELKSAYRPPAYQEHLQAVWDKWMQLRNNTQPGCQALRTQVQAEFSRHLLMESQRPVSNSDHTRGVGFDALVSLPAQSLQSRHTSLDGLAQSSGVLRPDVYHDPVHFRLIPGRSTRG